MPRRRPLPLLIPRPSPCCPPGGLQADEPGPERQAQLIRMVRQDCGSCHGIQLTGGLGHPELTQARMLDIPFDSLLATIYNGPRHPMPGWKSMIRRPTPPGSRASCRPALPSNPARHDDVTPAAGPCSGSPFDFPAGWLRALRCWYRPSAAAAT